MPRKREPIRLSGSVKDRLLKEFTAPGYTLITAADPADQTAGRSSFFVTLKKPGKVRSYISRTAGQNAYV